MHGDINVKFVSFVYYRPAR